MFYIVDASVLLKGPYPEADLRLVEESFHLGDLRDGVGYLQWVRSFKLDGSIAAQQGLLTYVSNAKLNANASLTQVTKHCSDLWISWTKIAGNKTDFPTEAFYHRLLNSIPEVPETGKTARLREWVAVQITDSDPILLSPSAFLDRITHHATRLGIAEASHQVNAAVGREGGQRNGANHNQNSRQAKENRRDCCNSFGCNSKRHSGRNTSKLECVCCNASM